MQCQSCGSRNKIKLKDKHYCSDCGTKFHHPADEGTATTKPTNLKPAVPAQKSGNLLDLTRSSNPQPAAAQQPKDAKPNPLKAAQSIHGVRKQADVSATPAKTVEVATPVNPQQKHSVRAQRAAQVSRSPQIRKFTNSVDTQSEAPEQPEPQPDPVILSPRATYTINQRYAKADTAASMALHHQRHQPVSAVKEQPTATAKPGLNWLRKFSDFFKPGPRFAMVTSVALSVVVLAGYITYLNYPNLSMRVAASRAGVDANLPGYTPSGYSFKGPIQYSSGRITVSFSSNSDAGFINLSQSQTNWDSVSLLENYVLPKSNNYLTFQEKGLTIYLYGGNNAAWVNHGIFYSIEGNNFLNSDHIIKMATSL